jgi:uncharacterized protein (TIGR02246 family)
MAEVPSEDLKAIEVLHERDMAASKAGDFETLRSILSDDAVLMPPGGDLVRGKAQIDANVGNMERAMRQFEVLEYVLDFEEVEIVGDYAFEWGEIQGSVRTEDGGAVQRSTYKVMRILQRQPDGAWKVHRSIWNENPGA